MKLLFIHQNFPSPYRHLAEFYAADPANQVAALGETYWLRGNYRIPGVRLIGYETPEPPNPDSFFLAGDFDASCRRAVQAAGALKALKESGFEPDVILLHPDWGDGMLLRIHYPKTPLLAYAEYYYSAWSEEVDFPPAQAPGEGLRCLAEARNAVRALSFADAAHLTSPYNFQRDQLPEAFRPRASILPEGIDSDWFAPLQEPRLTVPPTEEVFGRDFDPLPAYVPRRAEPITFGPEDEVFSFGTRTLEPYRGWSSFIRALPRIQKERPRAHCLIIGRTWGYYGTAPAIDEGWRNWRDIYMNAVKDELDFSRIHFLSLITHGQMRRLFSLTRAHVYLTYPFIFSCSPMEAMSCGAPLVLSRTTPVLEVARHGENAMLVDFHDTEEIAGAVCRLLEDEDLRRRIGRNGRDFILRNYDLRRIWLPRWDKLIRALAAGEWVEPELFSPRW